MIALLFPFQGEMTYFLGPGEKLKPQADGPLSVSVPAGRPGWRVAVCGQGKVEAALAAQILADRFSAEAYFLIGSATALDPSLDVGDVVLAEPSIEWDFGGDAVAGRPTFPCPEAFPDGSPITQTLRRGPVLSGDRDVFDPAEKAALRGKHQALALAWEGAGFHRFLRRNRAKGWELRLITETAGEGRPTLARLKERMAAGFPQVRKLVEAFF